MQETSDENCFYRTEGKDKYIGIPQHLLENYKERFRPLNVVCEVEKGVWVVPHFTRGLDEMGRRAHMYRKIGEEFIADDFAHEQSVVFETGKGLVIFNSCSHGGIVNIVREVQMALGGQNVYAVVGGFHMMKLSGMDTLAIPEKEVVETARKVTGHPIPAKEEPRRAGDPSMLIASSAKAREVLGWNPQYADLETIIGTAWKWHKSHPNGYQNV